MQIYLKTNDISIHSNFGVTTHWHLGLFIVDAKYATLSNVPYLRPSHPGILPISNNFTCVASYELKRVYDEDILVFHKVLGVKQASI